MEWNGLLVGPCCGLKKKQLPYIDYKHNDLYQLKSENIRFRAGRSKVFHSQHIINFAIITLNYI